MLSIKEQLAVLYVTIADFFDKHPKMQNWRESNNKPKFTDAEVLTLAMMQSYFRTPTLKRTFELVLANDKGAFPKVCSYKQWIARVNQLSRQIGALIREVAQEHSEGWQFYLLDSEPVPVCHPVRNGRALLLRDEGAYFGKTKKGWFFGFKLHIIVTADGLIINSIFTPGNFDDRDAAAALIEAVAEGSLCLADRGYHRPELQEDLFEEDSVLLITRLDAGGDKQALLCSVRERVETVFSQLWQRFNTQVYSRSWLGLWNSLLLKMLDHSLCQVGIISA
jgi:hypothetical protein